MKRLSIFILGLLLTLDSGIAFAHAGLVASTPAPRSTVGAELERVRRSGRQSLSRALRADLQLARSLHSGHARRPHRQSIGKTKLAARPRPSVLDGLPKAGECHRQSI